MMDYEQKYKDILERARKWLTPEFSHDMLYDIFPELRESEDERIRKELIETVKCIADGDAVFLSEQQKQRYLAWLEKQKEPLTPEEKMNHPLYLEGFDVGREVQKVFDEQKPAEWSEEDNIGWDEAFACVTRVEKAAKNEEELQNAVTAEKWLKEIKFKYCVHPVKSEWSEEDKEMLLSIINAFRNGTVSTIGQEQWLKTLHKRFNLQPKQEWSDEDEKKILFLERLIRYNVPEGQYGWVDGHKGGFVTKLEAISMLKSLRPHWKPSEEQMEAYPRTNQVQYYHREGFVLGYEQAEKDLKWHTVDEALPPMDEEVIVLLGEWNEVSIEPLYRIAFGHVVNKEYCEDFSGWNIPGVSFWMPMPEIPKEEKK